MMVVWGLAKLILSYEHMESGDMDGTDESRESEKMDNGKEVVIVLDAGHGGIDPGKVGVNGALEKEINLQIVLKLKELLEEDKELRFKVILTRSDDNGLYLETDRNKKTAVMKKRCEIANNANADIVVSIHQNSYHSSAVRGAQVFYYKSSIKGKMLAADIQKELVEQLVEGEKGWVEKSNDNYYLLLNVSSPAVIVECGFLTNNREAAALCDKEYQQKLATAISDGIKEYVRKNQ